jgi:hypothetical protein
MGLAAIFVTALSAVLRWGVANQAAGTNLHAIELILIALGAAGTLAALRYQHMERTASTATRARRCTKSIRGRPFRFVTTAATARNARTRLQERASPIP